MKLCFIDTETTGLDPKQHALIQVAGIIQSEGKREQEFSFKIRPFKGDLINQTAIAVNKLTLDQIAQYEEPQKIHGALINIFSTYVDKYNKTDKMFFLGYNGRFDYDFMRAFWEKNNDVYFGSFFWFPPIDIMNLAMIKLMSDRSKMKDFKLATVAEKLKVDYSAEASHEALHDVKAAMRIYEILKSLS